MNEPSVKDFVKIPLYLVALNVLGVVYYIYLIILFVWRIVFCELPPAKAGWLPDSFLFLLKASPQALPLAPRVLNRFQTPIRF